MHQLSHDANGVAESARPVATPCGERAVDGAAAGQLLVWHGCMYCSLGKEHMRPGMMAGWKKSNVWGYDVCKNMDGNLPSRDDGFGRFGLG
jgi:hypothetical protein